MKYLTVLLVLCQESATVCQSILIQHVEFSQMDFYEACPDSKYTKVLNMYNIFNLQKPHCQSIACT
jgi:hypothetical protein